MKNETKTFFLLYNSEEELVLLSSDTKFAIIKVNLNPEKNKNEIF